MVFFEVVLRGEVIRFRLAVPADLARVRFGLVHVVRNRPHVIEELAKQIPASIALHDVGTKHQVAEVTSLGLVQMTRKRVGAGLLEAFSTPCECCNGRGVILTFDPDSDGQTTHHPAPDEAEEQRGVREPEDLHGAVTYAELGSMFPEAGGQYVYLRESLGPLWGFMYGWTLFLVIQTGTIAAVGVAFVMAVGVLPTHRRRGALPCRHIAS